jgi:endonuclease/exonuclease/phosphatase (EEP) superfamily protein YafD
MLMGFRDCFCDVGIIDRGRFFISVAIFCRAANLLLEIMWIYGPADHSHSHTFLAEITNKINNMETPMLMGGDFNLIRRGRDKNNDNINWARVYMFNEAIGEWALREIPRTGARYIWSNRQLNPVRSVLDRVFISPDLEPTFPLCTVTAETSLGSDHTPLILGRSYQ